MLDALLAALKFVAILLAGILGIVGLLVDYKDKEGAITTWGRRALIGVVASSLVAAVIQGVEVYKQRQEAREAESRARKEEDFQNKTLSDIRRAVYPLLLPRDMYVSASAIVPITDEGLATYRQRLSSGADKFIQVGHESAENGSIRLTPRIDMQTNVKTFEGIFMTPAASLFPRPDSERAAWWILSDLGIEVDVYLKPAEPGKKPVDPSDYLNRDRKPEPDLHFRATTNKDTLRLEYSIMDANNVRLSSEKMLVSTEDNWRNPKNLSLPDLAGARMFITFKDWVGKEEDEEIRLRVEKNSKLEWVNFHIANRYYFISGFKLVPNSPYPVYVYTLPENIMEADPNLPIEPK
jgi:hypothetical protein